MSTESIKKNIKKEECTKEEEELSLIKYELEQCYICLVKYKSLICKEVYIDSQTYIDGLLLECLTAQLYYINSSKFPLMESIDVVTTLQGIKDCLTRIVKDSEWQSDMKEWKDYLNTRYKLRLNVGRKNPGIIKK